MCFPISRIAITIQTRSMNEAEGPALLILIQLSHFERVGLINFQFPNLSSFQIYQCRSMKRNRIADRTALRFRRRQDRKGKNQNEYYGDDRNNIFLHELHLDDMSRYPLLLSILDRVTGTAGFAVENRDESGGIVDKPLIPILIDIR